IISWTPTAAQGPGTYLLTTVLSDNGVPSLSATNSFSVTVTDVASGSNNPPVLPVQTNCTINELVQFTLTNTATDPDQGTLLTYQFVTAPAGATISSNGVITWLPAEPQA